MYKRLFGDNIMYSITLESKHNLNVKISHPDGDLILMA